MKQITLKELLEAGCHFGHKTNKWNPKAARFIYKPVGDTHIIDLTQTKTLLEKAGQFIIDTIVGDGEVMFVGTKRQASSLVKDAAEKAGAPYINVRWIGGLITNWQEVKKNIEKLQNLKKQLVDPRVMREFTKKEGLLMEREMKKLQSVYGGVTQIISLPAVLCIVDIKKEFTAVREAKQYNIPIVGIVDTNADPDIEYPIPANDDAVGSIQLLINYLTQAYTEGKEKQAVKKQKELAATQKAEQKAEQKATIPAPAPAQKAPKKTVAKKTVQKQSLS